ncbi:MAG TPA: phosphohydrolase [Acidimicrobiales bacterium]|nr:phosphohydrolase [Acidimicrobiales bacterium]
MTMTGRRAAFTSFEDATRDDWAIITPQIRDLQTSVPDRILEQLRYQQNDYGGFPIDRLQHTLQTATRAERDGRDEEYVVCALIHDIGDNLAPLNHPAVAAAIVKPFVSEANHWMVAHHGIFQGYYFWHHIGLDRDAREAYRDSPYFDYTAEFCAKYDQVAFDGDYRSEPLEHFEPLVRAYFGQSAAAGKLHNTGT